MKILVFLKKTPDTETKIQISSSNTAIETSDVKFIINPYDEYAIEEAIQIKEKNASAEVVIASFGDESVRELIIKGLAMGGDRGLLISNEGLADADSLTIAKILAAAVKKESPDLVLLGKQAIDDDNMHVGPMLAELLGWPHVNVVNKLSLDATQATAEREAEGGLIEVYKFPLPAVIGANKSLNSPRYAALPGIMKAKKKPFDVKTPADFGLDKAQLQGKVKVVVKAYQYPPQKQSGQIFQGEPVDLMVAKVVKLLREEAKVI
ncbi:MAG: electron transfer flavoprotein subunit beta/FixA family protein [Proteobacteria bacterium]|nr:electron transfer flavoprotein subunit beta/FixA family protein [Pseudomonadota bacterium]